MHAQLSVKHASWLNQVKLKMVKQLLIIKVYTQIHILSHRTLEPI